MIRRAARVETLIVAAHCPQEDGVPQLGVRMPRIEVECSAKLRLSRPPIPVEQEMDSAEPEVRLGQPRIERNRDQCRTLRPLHGANARWIRELDEAQ